MVLFKADQKTLDYLKARSTRSLQPADPDPDAVYAETYVIDGSKLVPKVALPHNVGNVKDAADVKDVPINQAVIASCCHGRMEDMEIAATIVKGKKVYPGVRFYVAPASWDEYKKAVDRGSHRRPDRGGRNDRKSLLRFLHRLPGGPCGRRGLYCGDAKKLQGQDGEQRRRDLSRLAGNGRGIGLEGRIVDPREASDENSKRAG